MLSRSLLLDKPTHALGLTQIINWGILFYTPALLSKPIAKSLGLEVSLIYAAFSWSLLVGGLFATKVGKALDTYGARFIMSMGTLFAVFAVILWANATGLYSYFLASTLLGLAMRFTLYEAAFSAMVEMQGAKSRPYISLLTLYGALASSIIWGITFYLEQRFGWRITLWVFAAMLLFISLPLNWFYLPKTRQIHSALSIEEQQALVAPEKRHKVIALFSLALMLSSVVFSSLAIHLITFLEGLGFTLAMAVLIASTKGGAQFIGRLAELVWGQKAHPISIAIIANISIALAFIFLAITASPVIALLFCCLYGIGQGLMTIVRGALPIVLFGRKGYGEVVGKIVTPSLILTSLTPFLFGVLMENYGALNALYMLLGFSFASLLSMALLKRAL